MAEQFVKTLSPADWDSVHEPNQYVVRSASTGLRGNDFQSLVKRAGTEWAEQIRRLLKPGDVGVHQVAVHATEYYGSNKNGDGFKEAACRKYHPTFTKHAKCYREHQNKDPERSYGFVKLSRYNEDLHRIELLTVLNGTKEAAKRNGGLVADEEMEALEKQGFYPVSMSCRVPFDVCSSCGNQAKRRSDYCRGVGEGGMCKGGGLDRHIGRYCGEPHSPILHADNTAPTFFDISYVKKPADRNAYVLGYFQKEAGAVVCGADTALALGVTAPVELAFDDEYIGRLVKLAHRLARMEQSTVPDRLRWAFIPEVQGEAEWTGHRDKFASALQALATAKVVMPLPGFLRFCGISDDSCKQAAEKIRSHLPTIYSRLVNDDLESYLANNPYVPANGHLSRQTKHWANQLAKDYTFREKEARDRATLGLVRNPHASPKLSNILLNDTAERLAKQYAVYKLAALDAVFADNRSPDEFTCALAIAQNRAL